MRFSQVAPPDTMNGLMSLLPANTSCTPLPASHNFPGGRNAGGHLDSGLGNVVENGGLRRHSRLRQLQQQQPQQPQQQPQQPGGGPQQRQRQEVAFKYTNCSLYEDLRNESFIGKKNGLFEPFMYASHLFAKTGSGQT
jgi:hypothetical protein